MPSGVKIYFVWGNQSQDCYELFWSIYFLTERDPFRSFIADVTKRGRNFTVQIRTAPVPYFFPFKEKECLYWWAHEGSTWILFLENLFLFSDSSDFVKWLRLPLYRVTKKKARVGKKFDSSKKTLDRPQNDYATRFQISWLTLQDARFIVPCLDLGRADVGPY